MKKSNRLVALVAVTALVGGSSACMGNFPLTKAVYKFNDTVTGDKLVNNLVFWGLGIVLQVYDFTLLGDLFIFNVIEFWTGAKLLADNTTPGDGAIVRNEDGSVTVTRDGQTMTATPVDATHVRLTRDGALVATLESLPSGGLVVTSADGTEAVVTPEEVSAGSGTIAALATRY